MGSYVSAEGGNLIGLGDDTWSILKVVCEIGKQEGAKMGEGAS